MIPVGVQILILIVFMWLVQESDTPSLEPAKIASEPPEKPRIINIVDSVVQRTRFDMGGLDDDVTSDAVEALRTLGYTKSKAISAIQSVQRTNPEIKSPERLVKAALNPGASL